MADESNIKDNKELISEICNNDKLSPFKMAEILDRMVMTSQINESYLVSYLMHNNLRHILQLYFTSPSEKKQLLKAPQSNPVCDWSYLELEYYGIEVIKIEQKEIVKMFVEIKKTKFSEKAQLFLKNNENFSEASILISAFNLFPERNQFQRKCFSANLFPSEESRVDSVMEIFLREVLDEKCFEPLLQHKIQLEVNKKSHWTTPDCLVWFLPLNVFGIICVEDKVGTLTENQVRNAEAQLIGEGVAACQCSSWLIGKPIFLLRFIGLRVTVYKAIFLESLLNIIKNGEKGLIATYILKYEVKDSFNREGFNLLDPVQREELVLILCCIENELKSLI